MELYIPKGSDRANDPASASMQKYPSQKPYETLFQTEHNKARKISFETGAAPGFAVIFQVSSDCVKI